RSASRSSGGVRGMRIGDDDEVVALEVVESGAMLLTISETGLGKRTAFDEYPKHSRGGQGGLTHNVTQRTGGVGAARAAMDEHELMLITESGIVSRTAVSSIAKVGRSAQGVQVMHPSQGDRVASVAVIDLSKAPPEPPATSPADGARRPARGASSRLRRRR